jgi:hypothetical protein
MGWGMGVSILLLINSSLMPANFAESWFKSSSTTIDSSAVALSVVSYIESQGLTYTGVKGYQR